MALGTLTVLCNPSTSFSSSQTEIPYSLNQPVCQPFWHQGPVLWKTICLWTWEGGGWFQDDSSTFHLLCTLLPLLLYRLHLRPSVIRSQRSGTPASTTLSGFLEAAGQQAATQKGTFRHSGRSQGSSRDRSGGPGTERREAETV